jgi:hypothetical protein
MQGNEKHEYDLLMSGDPERQRSMFRLALGFGGTLIALHIAVAASVIPYVYVSDPMANCGARVILSKFGSDVGLIGGLLIGAGFLMAFYRWFWVLPPPPPDIRLFRWGKPVFAASSGVVILAAIAFDVLISITDIGFLQGPPTIKWNDTVCPNVEWKTPGQP